MDFSKAASSREDEEAPWRFPNAHYLKLEKAKYNYYKAKIEGRNLSRYLKAWAKLLHIPKGQKRA